MLLGSFMETILIPFFLMFLITVLFSVMVGKGKQKAIEPPPVIRSGKHSFTVGSKFEAKDSLGKW